MGFTPSWNPSLLSSAALPERGADALLMAAWLHPLDTLARVWPFLEPAGTFSVFCPVLPPLQEVYDALRNGEHAPGSLSPPNPSQCVSVGVEADPQIQRTVFQSS